MGQGLGTSIRATASYSGRDAECRQRGQHAKQLWATGVWLLDAGGLAEERAPGVELEAGTGQSRGWGTRGSGASSSGGGYTWQNDRGVSGGNAWQTTGEVRGGGWGGSGGGGEGQGWMDDREAREKFLNEVAAKFRAMGIENLVIRGPD